jgi:hypothetical protein
MTVSVISKITVNGPASPVHADSRNQLHSRTVATEIFMDMLLNVLRCCLLFFICKNTCSLSLFLQQRSCLKSCLQSVYCWLRQNWILSAVSVLLVTTELKHRETDFQTCWATFCTVYFQRTFRQHKRPCVTFCFVSMNSFLRPSFPRSSWRWTVLKSCRLFVYVFSCRYNPLWL